MCARNFLPSRLSQLPIRNEQECGGPLWTQMPTAARELEMGLGSGVLRAAQLLSVRQWGRVQGWGRCPGSRRGAL